jgi:hypothetical protein
MRWRDAPLSGLVVMTELSLDCLRDEIAARLDRGVPLADAQDELIDQAGGLTEDERAVLWLLRGHTGRADGAKPYTH